MAIRQYKPVTAGRRGGSVSDFTDLTRRVPATVEEIVERVIKKTSTGTKVRKLARVKFDDGRVTFVKARAGAKVGDRIDVRVKPKKSLLKPAKKTGGRNNQGIVCTRFRGGGHKQMYRVIDFKRRKDGVWATVLSVEYDPNRSSRIALIQYEDGEQTYILAPEGLKRDDKIISGDDV